MPTEPTDTTETPELPLRPCCDERCTDTPGAIHHRNCINREPPGCRCCALREAVLPHDGAPEPMRDAKSLPAYWQDGRDISRELSAFIELVVRRMDRVEPRATDPDLPTDCGSCLEPLREKNLADAVCNCGCGNSICQACEVVFEHGERKSLDHREGPPQAEIQRLRAIEAEYDSRRMAMHVDEIFRGYERDGIIAPGSRFPSNPPDPPPVEPDRKPASESTPCLDECRARSAETFGTQFVVDHAPGCPNA